jgi:hypothetical protein
LSNRGTDEAGPNFVLGQVVANGLLGGETISVCCSLPRPTTMNTTGSVLANVGFGSAAARWHSRLRSRSDQQPVVDRDDLCATA